MTSEEMEPFTSDTPGTKMSFWNKLRLVMLALPRIYLLWIYRAAAVDPRVVSVRNQDCCRVERTLTLTCERTSL